MEKVIFHSLFTEFDLALFKAGKHFRIFEKMGSKLIEVEGKQGVYFAVWAPNAKKVSVFGDFNQWNRNAHVLFPKLDGSGIWEGFIAGVAEGAIYKYYIESNHKNIIQEKGDPYAFYWETPPATASIVKNIDYTWKDDKWMKKRKDINALDRPWSVYEVHLPSWKKKIELGKKVILSYRELAVELVNYVKEMNYTHVELMPVMEHPYDGSWGYQICGYFAPTSRFGTPQDFMYLIDQFHQNDIGVILDWVPSHFPYDSHGLFRFDGTALYEHEDPRQGYHPDWQSYIFNYGRNEVRSFLISNAVFWMDKYHVDGLRVDAVASMLYLDYSRKEGEWIPNTYGGRENLEAISFLKEMNTELYTNFEGIQTIAEESTSWPMVSRPVSIGGLGFGMKWMMGWMNDTLTYFKTDSLFRKFHHNKVTFSLIYAYTENFMLPLSHDEVVHGKKSILDKMPGDAWQRFANVRLLYAYKYTHPGAKLQFMGGEIAQGLEWNYKDEVNWNLLDFPQHQGIQATVKELNRLYSTEKALHEYNFSPDGFQWLSVDDAERSVLVYLRKGKNKKDQILVACNFTPVVHEDFNVKVPVSKRWKEIFNSDDEKFGGSGVINTLPVKAHSINEKENVVNFRLPPLGVVMLKIMNK